MLTSTEDLANGFTAGVLVGLRERGEILSGANRTACAIDYAGADECWGESESVGPGRNSRPRKRSSRIGYNVAGAVEIAEGVSGEIVMESLLFAAVYFIADSLLAPLQKEYVLSAFSYS